MSNLSSALQHEVDRKTASTQERYAADPTPENEALARAAIRRELDAAGEVSDLVERLTGMVMARNRHDYLVVALSTQHRTLLAQVMRAVSQAVVATTDEGRICDIEGLLPFSDKAQHPAHDGRLTCPTIRGARLAQHQPLI